MRPVSPSLPGLLVVTLLSASAFGTFGCGGAGDTPDPEESTVTVRTWRDSTKRYHLKSPRRIHLVLDYGDGSVTEQSRRPNQWRQDRPAPRPPAPTPAEIATARDLAEAHAAIRELSREAPLELAGGYLVAGDSGSSRNLECGAGSRCLEMFALRPGDPQPVAAIVVDLISREILVTRFTTAS